jgi:hypothetical protein
MAKSGIAGYVLVLLVRVPGAAYLQQHQIVNISQAMTTGQFKSQSLHIFTASRQQR